MSCDALLQNKFIGDRETNHRGGEVTHTNPPPLLLRRAPLDGGRRDNRGVCAMFPPFNPDAGRFERYWYADRPEPKRRSLSRSLARFAVLVALLAGNGLVLSNHHFQKDLRNWEQE